MSDSAPSFYTAAQIAAVLGKTPQAIRKALLNVTPAGVRIAGGNEAATWSVDSMPDGLRARLNDEARLRGYREVATMLANPSKRWDPPIPLSEMGEKDITAAQKLREALYPWLICHDPALSTAEIEAGGIADYSRVFGNVISHRYWRKLFARTLKRDCGAGDWARLELYVTDSPVAKPVQSSRLVEEALAEEFSDICAYVQTCRNPLAPTEFEERGIWSRAFDHYTRLVGIGRRPKDAARMLRDFLHSTAPFLAPSRNALLKSFHRKLARWQSRGEPGLEDRREQNGDEFEFPQQDIDTIEKKIVFHYGAYAPAWREAWVRKELSAETLARYRRPGRKSHVPHKLIATLGRRPLYLYTLHRRRKDFNHLKAHATSVYDGLHSLDCISADDVTLPVWFWFQKGDETVVTRGQCLVFIDLVSRKILGWSIQPDKTYNALVIFTQTARVLASKGVPKTLLWEHGIWERAKILTGSGPHSVAEITQGFKSFGIDIIHADTPEGKHEIEKAIGLVQNLMEGEPGYCGRDERKDRPDWIKKQLAEVQSAAAVHPSKFFYSFDQWNARLKAIFDQYNEDPQGGEHMRNRSPEQVYCENWNHQDPPARMGPELRYLLSHAKYEDVVTPSGVTVTSGNRKFKYFGAELQSLVGYRVLVWFDPEFPDVAVVTDMNRKRPIAVPLHEGVARLERITQPNGTALKDFCERRESQVQGIVARYNVLKDKAELPYRVNLLNAQAEQAITLGQRMEIKKEEIRSARVDASARMNSTRSKARKLNVPEVLVSDDADTREALALIEKSRCENSVDEQPANGEAQ